MVRRRGRSRGFTLLELIVVMAIIGILASIAMPALKDVPRRAQESALRMDLRTFRDVIDQYYGDKGMYPVELDDLVKQGYLRAIPVDPVTRSAATWVVEREALDEGETQPEGDQPAEPGIINVHSGSDRLALDGTAYKSW